MTVHTVINSISVFILSQSFVMVATSRCLLVLHFCLQKSVGILRTCPLSNCFNWTLLPSWSLKKLKIFLCVKQDQIRMFVAWSRSEIRSDGLDAFISLQILGLPKLEKICKIINKCKIKIFKSCWICFLK